MMHYWRELSVGDFFTLPREERLTEAGDWRPVIYVITEMGTAGVVHYRATHDSTILRTATIGWVIDHGRDIL